MDCFKNIQLKDKDSIHHVLFTDSSFSILPPYSLEEYENTLQRCKVSLGQNIILGYTDDNRQEVHYYIKEKESEEYQLLRKIRDLEAQMGFKYFATKFNRFNEEGFSAASAKTVDQLSSVRELDRSFTYFKHVMTKPLYCPIFNVNDYFLLFDHFNNNLVYYDWEGHQLDSMVIEYHKSKNWNDQLIQDYYTDDIYGVFEKGNALEVRKIDLSTGTTTMLSVQSKKRFPTKLRIRDQKLYYLQRDQHKPGLPQQLFELDIK